MPNVLRAVSYLAPNWFWFYEAISASLSRVIGTRVEFSQSAFDSLDDPAFRNDAVEVVFVCGLPYMRWDRNKPAQFAVLGAPVIESARYQDRPVYFADVIVNANSNLCQFNDLRGKTLCYNDQGSNSGYNLLRGWMLGAGLTNGFFGKTIQSGSHEHSIGWIVDGKADCSAIDSVVLEQAIRDKPELANTLHACLSIGPSPMPPVLAANRLGSATIARMRQALLHPDSQLAEAMVRAQVRRFAMMQPEDYAILGQMQDKAIGAGFATIR
ncbi:MAG: phosphate/phosphite/phosphonate ABC transporter substrate-binding protein [Aggregatilineales bacterium]